MIERKPERHASKPGSDPVSSAEEAERATQGNNELLAHTLRSVMSNEQRHQRIALLAYQRAQARGFQPGGELEDWLLAEREVEEDVSRGPA
jgi:hypothetical protein